MTARRIFELILFPVVAFIGSFLGAGGGVVILEFLRAKLHAARKGVSRHV
jgi:hypothetical protein